MKKYIIELFLFVPLVSLGVSSFSEYTFTTNQPPYGGSCEISPNNGTSLKTTFQISCRNWSSQVGSLSYRIERQSDANEYQLLSYGPMAQSSILLSARDSDDNYNVYLRVKIVDMYGASTAVHLTVQVNLKFN